jgi:hypothetical protein
MSNAGEILKPNNPANSSPEPKGERAARIPMSVPLRKLEVPEIPGYHTHWIKESNIPRALQAYYTFVGQDEVPVNQRNPGTDTTVSGNTDLGSQVSIMAGTDGSGKPERLVLMKLEEQYWQEDRAKIDRRNASVMESVFRGEKIIGDESQAGGNLDRRYVDTQRTHVSPALFNRRRAKV